MDKREKMIETIEDYLPRCSSVNKCYTYGNIPIELINNACMSYAGYVDSWDVLGLTDETIFGSGKRGFLFTEEGFYTNDNKGLHQYGSCLTYASLPSYNVNAFNEMLGELYMIECKDLADSVQQTVDDLQQTIDDLQRAFDEYTQSDSAVPENDDEPEECSQPLLPEQSEDDEETIDLDAAKEYVKEILLQTGDVIECDEDELDTFIEEAKALLNLMEDSDGDYEQAIDELLADEEHPKQMQKATTKCQQGLELYLPDLEDEPEQFETCQRIVRKYQQTVKQIRAQLKQL